MSAEQKPADLFDGLLAQPTPKTEEDWRQLEWQAINMFSPHAPIDDQALFAGRTDILFRLIDTVFQRGRHAILYGERGVGKSSLANIVKDQIFSRSHVVKVVKRNCTTAHTFRLMWVHALDDYTIDGKTSEDYLGPAPNPYDIFKIVDMLPLTERPVFIFDEFDRIGDRSAFPTMADTIKYFADYASRATIIIVGVADNVAELFGGHPSIQRNVQQIKMPRMSPDELRGILGKRLPLLGVELSPDVEDAIIRLSQGLPGYTHLLAQHVISGALKERRLKMDIADLGKAIHTCLSEADETVKDGYFKSVLSTKPANQYKEVLAACAKAQTDERGFFKTADIRGPLSEIMGRDMDIPHYARHLKEFCDSARGPALIKLGKPKSYQYRFADPLLRPYVILRGMADGMLTG